MRTYEKTEVTQTREICTCLKCDICGKEGTRVGIWNCGYYEVNKTELQVTVHQQDGSSYPDGSGWGTEITIDMCPECFRDKLVPWVNSQGGNVKPQEWEC